MDTLVVIGVIALSLLPILFGLYCWTDLKINPPRHKLDDEQ